MKGSQFLTIRTVEFISLDSEGQRQTHTKVTGLEVRVPQSSMYAWARRTIRKGRRHGLYVVKTTCGKWFYYGEGL